MTEKAIAKVKKTQKDCNICKISTQVYVKLYEYTWIYCTSI